jgi:DNA-binding phage protein
MLPILIYSLNMTCASWDEEIWLSSLNSLKVLIKDNLNNENQYFLSHIEEIIERLLLMSQFETNMNIRLLALECMN